MCSTKMVSHEMLESAKPSIPNVNDLSGLETNASVIDT